ncbi:Alpha/Beta hydrolase protein [Aspergillus alliaceus]|uniref:Alpha/Beta hydrolase protein n=1 Tax=Petromyces alliaceus TaxID=209559 RepID=UPI0012A4DC77|nr:Alpha/Beta hydrolase protein [Aspergillus alliaceus]KAB8237925.1 Alpha/Beta hydrolase protein [Aspergillus alliaceus]
MLWIHGGGFITGSKTASGDPSGLLWAADEPIIYVAINYRLGGLGFLAGQEVATAGVANAGLHDQRAAFRWAQDHIAAFGGNPADITVFGESAGAASIMYHLTGYGGKDCPPFRRAILQSNGFCPWRGHANNEARFLAFANAAGCSDLECLRNASTEAVIQANINLLVNSTEMYQPQIDGNLVPDYPGWLLSTGKFCSDVEIMVGNNDDEGGWMLNNPAVHEVAYSNDTSKANIEKGFTFGLGTPLTTGVMERLLELYPAPSNRTTYSDMLGLMTLFQSEQNFLSSTFAIVNAWKKHVFAYKFSVGYAIHAMDVPYTYYDGPTAEVKNATAAIALQKYLTRFAITGDPNQKPAKTDTLPLFLRMDTSMTKPVFKIDDSSYEYVSDDYFMNERTEFLASGLWI